MLRVGVDLVEVARIQGAMDRYGDRFFARFFTDLEREQAKNVAERLAARLAAKEAAAKALGTGIGDVSWVDIEIDTDSRGRPQLRLHNAAAELAMTLGLQDWQVSLSHTKDHAIAFVVALGMPPRDGDG